MLYMVFHKHQDTPLALFAGLTIAAVDLVP
jgi:hypothetical protein